MVNTQNVSDLKSLAIISKLQNHGHSVLIEWGFDEEDKIITITLTPQKSWYYKFFVTSNSLENALLDLYYVLMGARWDDVAKLIIPER